MSFGRTLWRVEWRALATLASCAILVGLVAFIQASTAAHSLLRPTDAAWAGASYAFIFGIVPVVAFGAPVYAAVAQRGRSSVSAAVAIGVVPGLLLLWYERNLAAWFIACGAAVALVTHLWFIKSRVP